jgi:hypothetical protein
MAPLPDPPTGVERYEDPNDLAFLSQIAGVPVVEVRIPSDLLIHINVIDTRRQARAWRRVQRKRDQRARRAWRREYPWHVRYPNVARVVFWSMIALGLFALYKA